MTSEERKNAVERIKVHALKHYEKRGWDYIVECMSDPEIDAMLLEFGSLKGAFKEIVLTARLLDERRTEYKSEAW